MPKLAKIIIYPIKSLDGVAVNQAIILPGGALQHDRELAIADEKGKIVNAKRTAKIHLVRSRFDLQNRTVSLQVMGTKKQLFQLDEEQKGIEGWLSDFFGFKVKLQENLFTGFPDDLNAPGPTVVSTATLTEVASWFPDISVEQIRDRFRANLEIDDVPPFWEDQLFAEKGDIFPFHIGDVLFEGTYPCQRCPVPTRDAFTGETYPNFQKIFVEKRQQTLPKWANLSQFNHFYRLTGNTQIPASQAGKILKVGDVVHRI
ncbi:MOSC N-terminal beta barrel domain-containing protein [Scytonema hofmannii FACHB-248]|uniref:MOSC N-terminal beta barrel domain-containing protein n=1 Tax=Scytonema hofmannii FACHB-248 TaxID=1842502 RepID=A0ABR8H015_9CYAN|nr:MULTISPECIES: MOSC N-terminal beta barrel domain-containing protein [Nostocales]MBD2608665.1 MOSC N-terminal beta barrel domain-containing protein [Scytonema hofmannii FACHB-248]